LKKTFYSNGKLLLTGEYTVLDGATALALPTKQGQYLDVEPTKRETFLWTALDANGTVWLEEELSFSSVRKNTQLHKNHDANTLIGILHEAHKANPELLKEATGFAVTTRLTFPRQWGLGTSSTLINNIAQWFGIDAFALLTKSFGGSGYDIACAQNDTAICYQLENGHPIVVSAPFHPSFANSLYFVYLNQKQNSRAAIAAYRERRTALEDTIERITELTEDILKAKGLQTFAVLLEEHENLMSAILGLPTVKQNLFPDFNGTLKSLGAWGGDFILAVTQEDPTTYFNAKGYNTVIPYAEMILS
jgi:mevalonate kinase